MPDPIPKYQPQLRPEDVDAARNVLRRRNSKLGEARRASLALLLSEDPATENRAAARVLGMHENTVRNWRKRWTEEGFSLEDKPRSGRPRFFPPSAHHDDQEHRVRGACQA